MLLSFLPQMLKIHKSYIPIYKGGVKLHSNNKILSYINKNVLTTDIDSLRVEQKSYSSEVSFISMSNNNLFVGLNDGTLHCNETFKIHKSKIMHIYNHNNLLLTCSSDKTARLSVDGQILATIYCMNIPIYGLIEDETTFVIDIEGNVYKREGKNTVRFNAIHMKPYKIIFLNGKLYCIGKECVVVYFVKNGTKTDVFLDEKKIEKRVGSVFYQTYEIYSEDFIFLNNNFYFVTGNNIIIYDLEMNLIEKHAVLLKESEETSLIFKSIDFDSQFIVTTTEDEILFLDEKYAVSSVIIGNNDEITDMEKLDEKLYICTNSGRLRYMDINNEESGIFCCKAILLEGHIEAIMSISSHNNRILTCSKDSTAILWESDTKTYLETHLDSVNSCDMTNEIIVSVGSDRTLQIYTNTPKPKHIYAKVIHEKEINVVKIHAEKKIIATASHDKTIKIFSYQGEEIKTLNLHKRGVWTLDLGKDILVSGSGDETIRIWSLSDYECIRILEGHTSSVIKVKLYDSDRKLLSCDNGNVIKIWDIKKGKILFVVNNINEKLWSVLTEEYIYTAGAEGVINVVHDETDSIRSIENEKERIKKQKKFELVKLIRENDYFEALKIAYEFDDIPEIFNLIENCFLNGVELNELFKVFESDRNKIFNIMKVYFRIFKYNNIVQPIFSEMLRRKHINSKNKVEFLEVAGKIFRNVEDLAIGLKSLELLFKDILIDELKE